VLEKPTLGFLALRWRDLDIARRARNFIPQVLNAEYLLRYGEFVGIAMFRLTTHLGLLVSSGPGAGRLGSLHLTFEFTRL